MSKITVTVGILVTPTGRVIASEGTSEWDDQTDREQFVKNRLAGKLVDQLTFGMPDVGEWLSDYRASELLNWLQREKRWKIHWHNTEVEAEEQEEVSG